MTNIEGTITQIREIYMSMHHVARTRPAIRHGERGLKKKKHSPNVDLLTFTSERGTLRSFPTRCAARCGGNATEKFNNVAVLDARAKIMLLFYRRGERWKPCRLLFRRIYIINRTSFFFPLSLPNNEIGYVLAGRLNYFHYYCYRKVFVACTGGHTCIHTARCSNLTLKLLRERNQKQEKEDDVSKLAELRWKFKKEKLFKAWSGSEATLWLDQTIGRKHSRL